MKYKQNNIYTQYNVILNPIITSSRCSYYGFKVAGDFTGHYRGNHADTTMY